MITQNNTKFHLLFYLFFSCFLLNAQTFVTFYSDDFEDINDAEVISNIGFSWWGNRSVVKKSTGNGANQSNGYIITAVTPSVIGISKDFLLTAGKKYRISNAVKFQNGLRLVPLRLLGFDRNNDYYYVNSIRGTGNWENYTHTFTVISGNETVRYQTSKNDDGELLLDNVKLEVEGIAWTGNLSTNWHTPGNWEGNKVPTESDHVLIKNVANKPIISDGKVVVKSLEIADGSKLLVNNNQIVLINGQLTGNTGYVEVISGSILIAERIVGKAHIIPDPPLFSVNNYFQSHMVLQRDKPISFYGFAENGLTVTVEFAGKSKSIIANNGKWNVTFDAMQAGGPYNLKVFTNFKKFEFDDILMGDVWICSGQSNMQQIVSVYKDFPEFTNIPGTYENDNIRLMTVKIYESTALQDEIQITRNWERAHPTTINNFSATGYFFGRYLHQQINVPIGLIAAARGGTSMGSFIPLEALNGNEFARNAYNYEDQGLSGPSTLYTTMIHPLTKSAVKGIIWYQGENEANQGELQTKFSSIFTTLINSWRNAWGQNNLPFIFNQLSSWGNVIDFPAESRAAEVRQQQLNTWNSVPNTGMSVSIDGGMTSNIHPPNKEDVGSRLSLMARKIAYGEDIIYSGPIIREAIRIKNESRAILKFKHFSDRLESRNITLNKNGPIQYQLLANNIKGFELAGSDGVFYKATAQIENDSILTVTSINVAKPVTVRYAWTNFPLVNLYNDKGLPASPFQIQIIEKESDNSLSINDFETSETSFLLKPTSVKKGEEIIVESKSTDFFTIEIRDTTGRQIFKTENKKSSKVFINSHILKSGLYFVILNKGKNTFFKKIIVH